MNLINFQIQSDKDLSSLTLGKGIRDFHTLCNFVKGLSYTRISSSDNLSLTISENCGTCSSKHAFLKQVAIENEKDEIKLIVGIFKMNAINTPILGKILSKHNLEFIPEAHCYLMYDNERFDFTKKGVDVNNFKEDILLEKEIKPEQVIKWKAEFHKEFISNWLEENNLIPYSLDEIWGIREECISELAK